MKLPPSLSWLRDTRFWQRGQDWRRVQHEYGTRAFLRPLIPTGALVFDVGANVGHKSLIFLSLGARVIAIEPQLALVEGFRRRFVHRNKIRIIHCAVGSARGTLTLQKCTAEPAIASLSADFVNQSRFHETHKFDSVETVSVRTLDDLFAEFGVPVFCKIDVEGYERNVIEGLSRRAGVISFEFNREFLDDTKACVGHLKTLGYTQFNACLGECPVWLSSVHLSADELVSRLVAEPNALLWGDVYALS